MSFRLTSFTWALHCLSFFDLHLLPGHYIVCKSKKDRTSTYIFYLGITLSAFLHLLPGITSSMFEDLGITLSVLPTYIFYLGITLSVLLRLTSFTWALHCLPFFDLHLFTWDYIVCPSSTYMFYLGITKSVLLRLTSFTWALHCLPLLTDNVIPW